MLAGIDLDFFQGQYCYWYRKWNLRKYWYWTQIWYCPISARYLACIVLRLSLFFVNTKKSSNSIATITTSIPGALNESPFTHYYASQGNKWMNFIENVSPLPVFSLRPFHTYAKDVCMHVKIEAMSHFLNDIFTRYELYADSRLLHFLILGSVMVRKTVTRWRWNK